jgi:hypothetical protein
MKRAMSDNLTQEDDCYGDFPVGRTGGHLAIKKQIIDR